MCGEDVKGEMRSPDRSRFKGKKRFSPTVWREGGKGRWCAGGIDPQLRKTCRSNSQLANLLVCWKRNWIGIAIDETSQSTQPLE